MVSRRIVKLLSALVLLIAGFSGCERDPLLRVENLIADYDYAEAIELLHGLPDVPLDTLRCIHLKALVFLIERQPKRGYRQLELLPGHEDERRQTSAAILYEAAKIVIREKNRIDEAIALLDSAKSFDPGLSNNIINLLWSRAIEYLHNRGDAGYRLMRHAIESDPMILGRLRGYNRKLTDRYQEMDRIQKRLDKWSEVLNNQTIVQKHNLNNLAEFISRIPSLPTDTTESGWRFDLRKDEDGFQFIAEADHKNPMGIPWKTVLYSP